MTQTVKSYVCLAVIFIAYGVVGEMDYRAAAPMARIEATSRNA